MKSIVSDHIDDLNDVQKHLTMQQLRATLLHNQIIVSNARLLHPSV